MMRCILLVLLAVALVAAGSTKKSKSSKHKRQVGGSCDAGEFQCANGQCIPEKWTCDSDNDCDDNSDETLPQCPPAGQCTGAHEIHCNVSGRCVSIEFRCDGENDCGHNDDTDERDCDTFECSNGEFKCANNMCIEHDFVCDDDDDCGDGSDEVASMCTNQ